MEWLVGRGWLTAPPMCSWAVIQIALVAKGLMGVSLVVCRRRPWRATDEGGGEEVVVDEEQSRALCWSRVITTSP